MSTERKRETNRALYLRKREAIIAAVKARRDANIEAERARTAAYYAANKPRLLDKMRADYAAAPEAKKRQAAKWNKANPLVRRALASRRRATKRAVGGSYGADDILVMLLEQRGVCVYCPASLNDGYHVDHKIPLSRGGLNARPNLQLLCPRCNLRKGALLPEEFLVKMGLAA